MAQKQKILVVDDRQENLFALETTLRESNAEIIKATSGNEALIATLNHEFALAILDVQMPGMNGYELAEFLRGEERTCHIPIIFLTAYSDEQQMFKGYGIGAMDYLVKPYDPIVLLSKVLAFLELDRQRLDIRTQRNQLEEIVTHRTRELKSLNEKLLQEINFRKTAEEKIHKLNDELEQLVKRRTAQLEAVNRELEAFAYSVSHDLRAPLRAIEGFSQAILEDYLELLDETGQDYLQRVSGEARRMAQLIEDLLLLSRVTRAEMNYTHIDMTSLAREILATLAEAEPGRSVTTHVQEELSAYGDTRLMRQALENLLSNAWKFTSKTGNPTIGVGMIQDDDGERFFIKDNGAGFDMEFSNKLFVPFQRLHGMDEFYGTGVGLSTVQRIIMRHGGGIWAEASVGSGATFYFTLEPAPPA